MEIIKNGKVFTKNFTFEKADIILDKGEIKDIIYFGNNGDSTNNSSDISGSTDANNNKSDNNYTRIIDANGLMVIPGLVDIHFHGCVGSDFCDATLEAVEKMAEYEKEHGIAAICPATMTLPKQRLMEICRNAKEYKDIQMNTKSLEKNNEQVNTSEKLKAKLVGINLEGPFISPDRVGAQNPEYVQKPDAEMLQELIDESGNMVKLVTIAPEREGAIECISKLHDKVRFSVGHTMANYDEATLAYESGAKHATHLYNAMTGFNHREPGCVGAIFDTDITTETIADGIHISYPALKIAYKVKSTDKVMLVSDSMMACCMRDGCYSLGGQDVEVINGAARLKNGALAGSVLTIDKAVANVYKNCGIPLYEAVKMATYNPAKHCNVHSYKGSIKEGYDADLLLFDENITIKKVFVKGKEVYTER